MLLLHLLAALIAALVAAVLSHRAGFSTGAVIGSYLLAGMASLATGAAIERGAEKVRARWAERQGQDDRGG
jgi:hypothetical protein